MGFVKCSWEEDVLSAKKTAIRLGSKLYVLNSIKKYKNSVVSYLLNYYRCCLTPNADVKCNSSVKFNHVLIWGLRKDVRILATGHYTSLYKKKERCTLKIARDFIKDQGFFLSNVGNKALSFFKFPLSKYSKLTIRYISTSKGFSNELNFKSSVGMCFFKNTLFKNFLRNYLGKSSFLLLYFTLGQKLNLNCSSNKRGRGYKVLKKNLVTGCTLLAREVCFLLKKTFYVHSVVISLSLYADRGSALLCKLSHGGGLVRVFLHSRGKSVAQVYLKNFGVCVAHGQPISFYRKRVLLGSGIVY